MLPALSAADALLIVDVQNDFCPGGRLPVAGGEEVVPVLNRWIEAARRGGAVIVASRDWHPSGHVSFESEGGPWPVHCVQGTDGAAIRSDLQLPEDAWLIDKGTARSQDAYSPFDGTALTQRLRAADVQRLWVGGLALDVCVQAGVLDGLALGFDVHLIRAATRAVDASRAEEVVKKLRDAGAAIQGAE